MQREENFLDNDSMNEIKESAEADCRQVKVSCFIVPFDFLFNCCYRSATIHWVKTENRRKNSFNINFRFYFLQPRGLGSVLLLTSNSFSPSRLSFSLSSIIRKTL